MARIIYPANNQVLVRRRERAKTSAGGIYLPDKRDEDQGEALDGEVLAVGPGRFHDYYANVHYSGPGAIEHATKAEQEQLATECVLPRYTPMPCKAGQLVVFSPIGATELEDGLWLVCDHNILATFEGGN